MISLNTTAPRYFVTTANASSITYVISFFLVVLAFFIHPYILTIIAAVFQLWFNIKSWFFLPVYSFSLAAFWGSRNYGVSYSGFLDDAIAYMDQFQSMQYENIVSLAGNFIMAPSGNELLYTLYVYTIRIFTPNEKVFAFFIYLLIASLTSVAAVLVHRRYYMVLITVLFFGVGSFAGLEILHLWRSAIASLLFLIAVTYYSESRLVAVSLMLGACFVHLVAVLLVLLFFVVQLNKYIKNKYIMLSVIFLFFLAFYYFVQFYWFYLFFFAGKDLFVYFAETDAVQYSDWIKLLIVLLLFYLLKRNKLDDRFLFMIAGQSMGILAYIFFRGIAFTGRFYQAFIVFTAWILFEIIMSVRSKHLVSSVLVVLFALKFYTLSSTLFMQQAYADFSNIFSGILFILNK